MDKRTIKWDLRFLGLCKYISQWSKDPSTKVASVIVRDTNKIVSVGYNGYASADEDDDSLNVREEKYERIIHAEKNAILLAQRDITGYTLYVWPIAPCAPCASFISQAGIKRVVSVHPTELVLQKWIDSFEYSKKTFKKSKIEFVLYGKDEVLSCQI